MRQLAIGNSVPDFQASTWTGESVRLSDWRGQKLWLAFFRYASCPLCNLRVHQMRERFSDWSAAGLALVAVFQSSSEQVERYVGRQSPAFEIVCDPEEVLYGLYGLQRSLAGYVNPRVAPKLFTAAKLGYLPGAPDGTKTRLPGDFLIDSSGVLADVFMGGDISEHIPFDRVGAFLRT
jgi:thioredoxin-dependent peroxiredoxin